MFKSLADLRSVALPAVIGHPHQVLLMHAGRHSGLMALILKFVDVITYDMLLEMRAFLAISQLLVRHICLLKIKNEIIVAAVAHRFLGLGFGLSWRDLIPNR